MSERESATESLETPPSRKCIVRATIESWIAIDFALNIKYRPYIEYCKSFTFE